MFDSFKGMLGNLGIDPNTSTEDIKNAAQQHVGDMDHNELLGHLQQAASNVQGQGGDATQLQQLISTFQSNPGGLKNAAVQFISQNPQVLQQFAPDFAKGLLSKL